MSSRHTIGTNRSSTLMESLNKSDMKFDFSSKFKITKRFVRKGDDIDSQLAGMAVTDGIQMNNATVVSCLETTRESLVAQYSWNYDKIFLAQIDGIIRMFEPHSLKQIGEIYDADVFMNGPCTGLDHRSVYRDYNGGPNIISTYSNGYVKCWDTDKKLSVFTINENRQVLNVVYHPRSSKFLTVGDDARVLMYDENSKTLERIFKSSDAAELDGHVSKVFSVCFNPTSNYEFITGGWDDVICFWDIRQLGAIRHISGPHICGDGLDISADGKEVLSCSWQPENQVCVWDYATGKLLRTQGSMDSELCRFYCGKFVTNNYIAAGGCHPNMFKLLSTKTLSAAATMSGFNGPIYCFDDNPNRKRTEKTKSALLEIPRILLSAGRRIYQIDFT